jgi:hypothetical protein
MSRTTKITGLVILLGVPLCVGICLKFGGHWTTHPDGRTPGSGGEGKAAIYKFLARQTSQSDFKSPFDLDLPARVTLLRSNASTLEQRTGAIRASLSGGEAGALLKKELDSLRDQVVQLKRAAGESKARLGQAESRTPADQTEIATLRAECEKKQAAWFAKRDELSSREAQGDTIGQQKRAALVQQLHEAEGELQVARRELREKEQELGGQENAYIRSTRQQAGEAGSYEALYRLIGQQLKTADGLLAGQDVARQRMGISFAREACRHAVGDAHNGWLAARIAEAYLWPNLALADYTAGSKERAQDVLQLCKGVFAEVGETNNLIKNYELMIVHAPAQQGADAVRLNLADLLEQAGDYRRATNVLKEIQETNLAGIAAQNLVRIQQRLVLAR